MSLKRLELDYRRPAGRRRLALGLLALMAAAFAADVGLRHHALAQEVAVKEARLARPGSRPAAREPVPAFSAEERAFARDTVKRLATPWERLFEALEAAQTERVALLAIEPDVENRTLGISGEARDYLAALSYVANLSEQRALRQVYLVRHEIRKSSPQRPLAFHVSARWGDER